MSAQPNEREQAILSLPFRFAVGEAGQPTKAARRPPRDRVGNWLSKEQANELLNAPDPGTLIGKRDRALLVSWSAAACAAPNWCRYI